MARNKLIPYSLKVREKGQTTNHSDLLNILHTNSFEDYYREDLQNAPKTFIELFEEYCQDWQTQLGAHVDEDLQKTFRVSDRDGELNADYDSHIIEGICRYGQYGERYDAYNTETGESESNVIDAIESPDRPYYFLVHVPEKESEEAIVVLEERNNIGVKGRFQDALQRKLPSGIYQDMERMTDENIYNTIRNASSIKRFTVETSESPHELGGRFEDAFSPSSTGKQSTYTATDDGSIDVNVDELEDWMENDENPFNNVGGNTYTKFKLTVESAGSQTTIDFFDGNLKLSRLLEGVEREGGHPLPRFMANKARQFVNQELLPDEADSIPTESPLRGERS